MRSRLFVLTTTTVALFGLSACSPTAQNRASDTRPSSRQQAIPEQVRTPQSDAEVGLPADEPGDSPEVGPAPQIPAEPPNSWSLYGGGPKLARTRGELYHRRSKQSRSHAERIHAALDWLVSHQAPEGHWSAAGFRAASMRPASPSTGNLEFVCPGDSNADAGWEDVADIGITGLALLAFSANGYSHRTATSLDVRAWKPVPRSPRDEAYSKAIRAGTIYLRRTQSADGCFGPKDDNAFVYSHAIATLALAELYALTGEAILRVTTEQAVSFILAAQNPGVGWRYGVKPAFNDTCVTGWMLLALHTAKRAGIEFDHIQSYDWAKAWLELVTVAQDGRDTTGYDTPGGKNARLRSADHYEHNPATDAVHGTAWLFFDLGDLHARRDLDFASSISECAPKWEHKKLDYHYWFWAGMFLQLRANREQEMWWGDAEQAGHARKARDAWWEATAEVLTKHQRGWHELDTRAERTTPAKLDEHGSWDAVDAWSPAGGRVYATAMGVLTLSLPWRFAPPTGKAPPETPQPDPPKEK